MKIRALVVDERIAYGTFEGALLHQLIHGLIHASLADDNDSCLYSQEGFCRSLCGPALIHRGLLKLTKGGWC